MKKPFSWYGGKYYLLNILDRLVPTGGLPYCEPYGGSAALLFHRRPARSEVINDLDGNIVNFFRVLQSHGYMELARRLEFTPYALDEFLRAKESLESDCPIERAWAFFTIQNQIHSGLPAGKAAPHQWSRVRGLDTRKMASVCHRWKSRIKALDSFRRRLMRVQIDHVDAIDCIRRYDNPRAVFYIDPPYPAETRNPGSRDVYLYEASQEDLQKLCHVLLEISGKAVLSTYWSDIWNPLIDNGWALTQIELNLRTGTSAQNRRTECILQNPACFEPGPAALPGKKLTGKEAPQLCLF